MNSKSLWITVAVAVFSFIGGFLFANTFNRGELDTLRAENERLKVTSQTNTNQQAEQNLTPEEIKAKIEEADRNPGNFDFQKNLGIALYKYGAFKQDVALLKEAIRILQRADGINTRDRDIKIALGNGFFDVAYYDKTARTATADVINKNFEEARKYYDQSLSIEPKDAGVVTDVGLTYFLGEPADYKKAATELEKALVIDPKHERAIQFLVETKWRLGANDEALKYLNDLKASFPNNRMIGELTSMLTRPPSAQ